MLYADASALVKLVRREPESDAVAALFTSAGAVASSIVAWIEVGLAARRWAGEEGARRARVVMGEVTILDLTIPIADRAATLVGLRALDAIHLATALEARSALDGIVTYDARQAGVAAAEGLNVLAPW